jgi:hypothetical protein
MFDTIKFLAKKLAPTALLLVAATCFLVAGMPLACTTTTVFAVLVFVVS